jgi:hypothetical protein
MSLYCSPRARVVVIFVLDRSSSMEGSKWATARDLVRRTIAGLPFGADGGVEVILAHFNERCRIFRSDSSERLLRELDSLAPAGGTLLFHALEAVLPILEERRTVEHIVVECLTDDETQDEGMRGPTLDRYAAFFKRRASISGTTQIVVRRWNLSPSPFAAIKKRIEADGAVKRAIERRRLSFEEAAPSTQVDRPRELRAALRAGPRRAGQQSGTPLVPELRFADGRAVDRIVLESKVEVLTPRLILALPPGQSPPSELSIEVVEGGDVAELTFAAPRTVRTSFPVGGRLALAVRPRYGVGSSRIVGRRRSRLLVKLHLHGLGEPEPSVARPTIAIELRRPGGLSCLKEWFLGSASTRKE